MAKGTWVWAKALTAERKAEVTAACERLIADMKSRFLPVTHRPPAFAIPIDIRGRWRGESYSFVVRFRSQDQETPGEEYDAPFARIEHFNGRFAVAWMRHTGRWWPLRSDMTLDEAIAFVATEPALRPPI